MLANSWKTMSEVRRTEIRRWLAMNGVRNRDVPIDTAVSIEERPDGSWAIRYTSLVLDDTGRVMTDPADPDLIWQRERLTPLTIDPPVHWYQT